MNTEQPENNGTIPDPDTLAYTDPSNAAPQPQNCNQMPLLRPLSQDALKAKRHQELLEKYKITSAQEMHDTDYPPLVYRVDGILPEGMTLMVASPKTGKSWMAMHLAICLASGQPFLGNPTAKCNVLYIALEDSPSRLKRRMELILKGAPPPDGFYMMTDAPGLDDGFFEFLDAILEVYPGIKMVIIDTLQKIRGSSKGREGAYAADYREIGHIHKEMLNRNISSLLIHHTRKMGDDSDVFQRVSGTTGIMGAADTTWMITKEKRSDDTATLTVTGRDARDTDLVIRFDQDAHVWQCVGTKADADAEEALRAYEESPVVQAIKELVAGNPGHAWDGYASEILAQMGLRGTGYSAQMVSKEIARFEAEMNIYDNIRHTVPNTKTTGGKRHFFYVSFTPAFDADVAEAATVPSAEQGETAPGSPAPAAE